MIILFLFCVFFAIFLFILALKNIQKTNQIKLKTQPIGIVQSKQHAKFTQKQKAKKLLENSDKLLTKLKNFDENVGLKTILAFGLFLLTYFLGQNVLGTQKSALIGMLGFIFVFLFAGILRKIIVEARLKKINDDLPMFVDMLAVCVQAGMNVQAALEFLSQTIGEINKDFAPFLLKMTLRSQISGIANAIDELEKELPSTQVSMMCTTLRQSLKYGSTVYEQLMNLSQEIREFGLLKTEEEIGKLSAKMSVPLILFFMFPVIIIIAAPGILKVLGGL